MRRCKAEKRVLKVEQSFKVFPVGLLAIAVPYSSHHDDSSSGVTEKDALISSPRRRCSTFGDYRHG